MQMNDLTFFINNNKIFFKKRKIILKWLKYNLFSYQIMHFKNSTH